MKKIIFALSLVCAVSTVSAKLAAPSAEAADKAAAAAAKTSWTGKSDAFLLCKSQDKVAATYLRSAKGKGMTPTDAGACTDPGPFVYTPPVKPLTIEAAGAHSPAGTAVAPATAAVKSAVPTPAKKS